MKVRNLFFRFMNAEGGGDGSSGGGAPSGAPAPSGDAGTGAGDAGNTGGQGDAGTATGAPGAPGATGNQGGAPASGGAAPNAGSKDEGDSSVQADWPTDWREKIANGDDKLLGRLGRYASPIAMAEALISAQNRISKGELKPVLGKNPSDEQLKEYREAMGIPESHDKYDIKDIKTDGIDPQLMDVVLQHAHQTHQTPEQVKSTLQAWTKINEMMLENQHEADVTAQKEGEDALRAEWGPEFRRNITMAHNLLDGKVSPEFKDKVLTGRLADGTPIGSSPEFLRLLVDLALVNNPAGTLVPGGAADPVKGINDEIASIEKVMKENRPAYNKDEKMQTRLRELYEARETMKRRAA